MSMNQPKGMEAIMPMLPEYEHAKFLCMEYNNPGANRDVIFVPAIEEADRRAEGYTIVDRYDKAWWTRLSAPGFLDKTEWSGPFETMTMAMDHIKEFYRVDPISGRPLGEPNA